MSLSDDIDALFKRWDNRRSPGVAIAVKQDRRIIHARGYGMADLDHDIPITPDTPFFCASLAKQFTAMCILLLVNDKKLALSDDVHRYIPVLSKCIPPITIRQLLDHTSGLRCMLPQLTLAGWRWGDDAITRDQVLDLVRSMRTLSFSPGTSWSYSNTNYFLAGEIVHRVSGAKLSEFAKQRIFEPLGLTRTKIVENHGALVHGRAYGSRKSSDGHFERRMPNYDLTGPTNMFTTVMDIMRWDDNFDCKKVGGESAFEEMLKHQNDGKYGLGLWVDPDKDGKPFYLYHNGTTIGHRAFWIRYVQHNITLALLCNQEFPRKEESRKEVLKQIAYDIVLLLGHRPVRHSLDYASKSVEAKDDERGIHPSNVNVHVGRYYNAEIDTTFHIERFDDSLAIVRHPKHKQRPAILIQDSADTFHVSDLTEVLPDVKITFYPDPMTQSTAGFRLKGHRLHDLRFLKQNPSEEPHS
jgi:CubicO group peptidase (beta-lactamase class C family)